MWGIILEKNKQESITKQRSSYISLLYKWTQGFDGKWFYQVKEVDRRLSYPIVQESSVICDVGGAQGIDSFAFAEKGAFVINLDTNGHGLKFSNKKAHELGLDSNLNFIKASATALPFKDEAFDLITCFSVLDHLPNKRSAYAAIIEFSRVVQKRGHVAITLPNYLFLIGTVSMKVKSLTDPKAFFEQRFSPKELFYAMYNCKLLPIVLDSEFPKTADPEILVTHFPKLFKKMPGAMALLSVGATLLDKFSKLNITKLLGARMGYLAIKTDN